VDVETNGELVRQGCEQLADRGVDGVTTLYVTGAALYTNRCRTGSQCNDCGNGGNDMSRFDCVTTEMIDK